MTPEQLAELTSSLLERREMAQGVFLEFIERHADVRLTEAQRAELSNILSWQLGMAAATGVSIAL